MRPTFACSLVQPVAEDRQKERREERQREKEKKTHKHDLALVYQLLSPPPPHPSLYSSSLHFPAQPLLLHFFCSSLFSVLLHFFFFIVDSLLFLLPSYFSSIFPFRLFYYLLFLLNCILSFIPILFFLLFFIIPPFLSPPFPFLSQYPLPNPSSSPSSLFSSSRRCVLYLIHTRSISSLSLLLHHLVLHHHLPPPFSSSSLPSFTASSFSSSTTPHHLFALASVANPEDPRVRVKAIPAAGVRLRNESTKTHPARRQLIPPYCA